MNTQEVKKLNKLEKSEGEYKASFLKEMKKLSKDKADFKYCGKGSLLGQLR